MPGSIAMQPDTWNPPIATWMPCAAQPSRDVHRARKLIALHADEGDQSQPASRLDPRRDPLGTDASVGLVRFEDVDRRVRPEHLPLAAIRGEAVERGQRVRGDGGPKPLDHVAIIVVVRRLDEMQLKAASWRLGRAVHTRRAPVLSWDPACLRHQQASAQRFQSRCNVRPGRSRRSGPGAWPLKLASARSAPAGFPGRAGSCPRYKPRRPNGPRAPSLERPR